MSSNAEMRIEPAAEILSATRGWLDPIRTALGPEFLSAYLTGSVLTQGFDRKHSRVNVLVVARTLDVEILDRVRAALPTPGEVAFDPLFLTRTQIEQSLDSFAIEWLEISERHMLLEGADLVSSIEVAPKDLRLQCERELRAKFIQLRQAYLFTPDRAAGLVTVMKASASSFATLFRTLMRLRGETPPANQGRVVERVADLYQLDAESLLGAHLVRYSERRYKSDEIQAVYRKFLAEIQKLVIAIDQLSVQ